MKGFGYLFEEGIKGVWNNRGMSIASIGILVSCLLITGVAVLFCQNLQMLVSEIGDGNITTVFLDFDMKDQDVQKVGKEIERLDNVSKVAFYSKEEGIKEFRNQLGDVQDEFTGKNNPLPDAFKVTMTDLSKYETTAANIANIEGVQEISNKKDLANTFTEISNLVATAGFWIVLVLCLVSLFIVSTAVKTTMHSRRFEISIMKSVGATDAFVRVPFIVEGVVLGILSGMISSILLKFLYEGLIGVMENNISATVGIIDFSSIVGYVFVAMVSAGAFLGVVGAVISIGKYLKLEGNELLGW